MEHLFKDFGNKYSLALREEPKKKGNKTMNYNFLCNLWKEYLLFKLIISSLLQNT